MKFLYRTTFSRKYTFTHTHFTYLICTVSRGRYRSTFLGSKGLMSLLISLFRAPFNGCDFFFRFLLPLLCVPCPNSRGICPRCTGGRISFRLSCLGTPDIFSYGGSPRTLILSSRREAFGILVSPYNQQGMNAFDVLVLCLSLLFAFLLDMSRDAINFLLDISSNACLSLSCWTFIDP
jgi:hypothetical protein